MTSLVSRLVERAAGPLPGADRVTLDYEGRFLRRKTLTTASGARILIDLAETVSLNQGDAFVTEEGARIAIEAAPEPLVEVRALPGGLARLAWHIGNRHTPAQIEGDRILIRRDHVLEAMLTRLQARLNPVMAPFTPEGGAYGQGRTHGHHHGGATDDPNGHGHGPAHVHHG